MSRRRPDGWWYPWIFVAGFAVVIAVNGAMLHLATSTFSGLSVEKAFERGNAYNAEIAAQAAQAAQGWQADFGLAASRIEADDSRRVRFRLAVADASGRPVEGLAVALHLERPAAKGFDRDLPLAAQGNGVYAAETVLPLKGQWEARLVAGRAGAPPLRLRSRVQVP
jgi:nitrogen fixation protein FixH